jgi:diaminohydroxyphosphoribosylaminopyrimidine deaminase/5-amino-6-(5-phosphoribosylamino)uracil reductase
MAIENSKTTVKGSTLYVTLEPCNHFGKTPPCTELIIESGIKRVVIATEDPNPRMKGKSIEILKQNKIETEVGVLKLEAEKLNECYNKFMIYKIPFVTYKYAMTLDGKISTLAGDSKWVSCETSRKEVQRLRHKNMAIMVGVNTVINDNPRLDSRDKNSREIIKIVIDSNGRTPLDSKLFDTNGDVIIATTSKISKIKEDAYVKKGAKVLKVDTRDSRVNLQSLMLDLYKLNMDSVLLEGGATLAGSMLKMNLVDKLEIYIAPKIIGEGISPVSGICNLKMSDSFNYFITQINRSSEDIYITAYRKGDVCSQDS